MRLTHALWRGTALCAILCSLVACMVRSPPTTLAARPRGTPALSWLQGWPMVGHDPQRTNRSPSRGPLHPRLLFTSHDVGGQPLIGPDGRLYGWGPGGLTALAAFGQHRWTIPFLFVEGSQPVLAPDNLLVVNAFLPPRLPGMPSMGGAGLAIVALTPTGHRAWIIRSLSWAQGTGGQFLLNGRWVHVSQSVPNSKAAAPLATVAHQVYLPFLGPGSPNTGLEVVTASTGHPVRRVHGGFPPNTFAQAPDGTVYELGGENATVALAAVGSNGVVRWTRSLRVQRGAQTNLLVGSHGVIYATAGMGSAGELVAFAPTGRLLWRRVTTGPAILAQRADGPLLLATPSLLSAINTGGQQVWQVRLGRPGVDVYSPPCIAVDAAGRAFVGSPDGMVRAIGPDGTVLWSLPAGGPRGTSPFCALGPAGRLMVVGTDGVLHAYH